jgi:osmotically inducible protein OsmC
VGSNPEELLAAAEAACFSMALAGALEKNGTVPESVHTEAACTVEKSDAGFTITRMKLNTRVRARGIEEADFQRIARETKQGCPVSRALTGVDIQLQATLE